MHKGTVVFLVLVAALLLSTHYWPEYVNIHRLGYLIEVPIQVVQVAITVALLCASVCVILAPAFGPKDKHCAYGMVGIIIGFWFK